MGCMKSKYLQSSVILESSVFFDDGQLIVLTNCFVKKTQKTPKIHLNLAIKLKKEYFLNKK